MSTNHELEQRIKRLETLLGRGVEHLSLESDGTLMIDSLRYDTPQNAGYITDQYGNFIHSRNSGSDSWYIYSNNGTPKLQVTYEGNIYNRIGGGLTCTNSLIDTKQSNNGISTATGNTYLNMCDKNNLIMSAVRNEANPNGSTKVQLQARNYNSSGTLVKTGLIGINVAKDGALSYEVTEPEKFHNALNEQDWVIAKGQTNASSYRWWWRKWDSGILELDLIYQFDNESYTTWNTYHARYVDIGWENDTGQYFIDTMYHITQHWEIGSGFSIPATVLNRTTRGCRCYGLGSESGKKTCRLSVHLSGRWK